MATFDPALFGMPAGMQLPVAAQEQLIKQFQAMPKKQQQIMMQEQARLQQQATAQQRHPLAALGGPAMPVAAAPSTAQPSLCGGNPGANLSAYPSELAGELTKGVGNLIKRFGTPGSFSANHPKHTKKPSNSTSDGKGDRDSTTIKMFNSMVKSSFNMVGLG